MKFFMKDLSNKYEQIHSFYGFLQVFLKIEIET